VTKGPVMLYAVRLCNLTTCNLLLRGVSKEQYEMTDTTVWRGFHTIFGPCI
jgi:hypothetical protein